MKAWRSRAGERLCSCNCLNKYAKHIESAPPLTHKPWRVLALKNCVVKCWFTYFERSRRWAGRLRLFLPSFLNARAAELTSSDWDCVDCFQKTAGFLHTKPHVKVHCCAVCYSIAKATLDGGRHLGSRDPKDCRHNGIWGKKGAKSLRPAI